MDSVDESSADNDSDCGFIGQNALEDMRYGSYVYPDINATDYRLKIHDRIKQAQRE